MKPTSLFSVLALAVSTFSLNAQDAVPQTPVKAEEGRQRGGNPQEFMQRMNERLKGALKVTDEEWTVLQPLIEKVQTALREASPGRGGFGRRPDSGTPSPAPTSGDQPNRGGSAESLALRAALEVETTTPEEIKVKLAAVREARKKGLADLVVARENLKQVVTVRQEAVLVSMGLLE